MTANPHKDREAAHFDSLAKEWSNSDAEIALAATVAGLAGIREGQSLLDVASGTGVIPAALRSLNICLGRYLALDISPAMLEALRSSFPEAGTVCADFEEPFAGGAPFDYVLIYNSIPHFTNLEMLFANAQQNLQTGGLFLIAHSRTRQGLREHHARIGHKSTREPIPQDGELAALAAKYHFGQAEYRDEDLFCFSCRKL
ncbi:class I SAM-dependent methyltransferase [Paenibacillus sp. MMS20-IR301]|uniref:class I SAM-dependent methyltransferase n=1 Tax=Paenibacillus sp. MMS20-IR301 TaxID=2895946 RepID=UPI0028E87E11|nr:class I SAM-dependent methyltransferase [Paenibacillus sp. MMS20-IR301]WNS42465.1 class I SAM-dependent methyltransferase [Paenibacillus sp. MMS20-IR301]